MNRDMLSRRLIRRGHEVMVAIDGPAGIVSATNIGPMILMDVSLPGSTAGRSPGCCVDARDGSDPDHRLDRSRDGCRPPAVIEAGCDDFDTKPVDLARLLSRIEAQLVVES